MTNFTIPNILTVYRILNIPLIAGLALSKRPFLIFIASMLFLAASFTDYLDGFLARRLKQKTPLGTFLDPLADKLMVITNLFVLVIKFKGMFHIFTPSLVILWRELTVSVLREYLAYYNVAVPVSVLGKWKATMQFVAIMVLLLSCLPFMQKWVPYILEIGVATLYIAALLSILSAMGYLRKGLVHIFTIENTPKN